MYMETIVAGVWRATISRRCMLYPKVNDAVPKRHYHGYLVDNNHRLFVLTELSLFWSPSPD